MPTASKLFACFAFALVGFFGAEMMKPSFPEGFSFGLYSPICAFIGAVIGWRVMGRNAGHGTVKAIGTGLRTSVTIVFWAVFGFACYQMILNALDRRYQGVVEAVEGIFVLMMEYGQMIATNPTALGVLIIGGMLGGMFANWAAERWS